MSRVAVVLRSFPIRRATGIALCLVVTDICWAQYTGKPPAVGSTPIQRDQPDRSAQTSLNQFGQRQRRDQAFEGVAPTARVANRIQNRIQLRIRNRIDRTYGLQGSATLPIRAAQERVRTASQLDR